MTVHPVFRRRASLNAPERTDPSKSHLLAPVRRARRILRWRRENHVVTMGLQETGSVLAGVASGRETLAIFFSAANSIIHGHRLGNAIFRDRRRFRVLDRDQFHVGLAGRDRPLSFPVQLLADKRTGRREVHIDVHKPRNVQSVDPGGWTRKAIDDELERRCRLYAATFPVVVYADNNGAPLRIRGFQTAVRNKADSITCSGFAVGDTGHESIEGASDHDVIWAYLSPTRINTTDTKLPKEHQR